MVNESNSVGLFENVFESFEPGRANRPKPSDSLPVKSVEPVTFDLADAVRMNQAERLQILLNFNNMQEAIVTGILSEGTLDADGKGYPYWLVDIQTPAGVVLKLPLVEKFPSPRIPLNKCPVNSEVGDRVQVHVDVVDDESREILQKRRPFALTPTRPPEPLMFIPSKGGSDALIAKAVWESELSRMQHPLQLEMEKFKERAEQDKQLLLNTNDIIKQETEEKSFALNDLRKDVAHSEGQLQTLEALIGGNQKLIKQLNTQRADAMAAYQEICDFARDRASILQSLNLITDEQLAKLTGSNNDSPVEDNHLSWQDDLHGQYGKAVSCIHAFLFNQGKIYPRWLVGDFLTLLRMNDLIILSGLSGAGKTQIVRSFAHALGGVPHIIPVKPNWTGAEDLLGFFNPLQRSYVKTPFLEALLAARDDPGRLHFICLDEMNLARAEYYFADFLSTLEDRDNPAVIPLYSISEESHVEAEVRMLLAAIRGLESGRKDDDITPLNIEELMQRPEFMERLRSIFGENAGESFPVFHGRIRRSLSTMLDVRPTITVSANVRFIGAINVDQTTYGLSPKILDRAHVIRFDNPLKYSIADIREDVEQHKPDVPRDAPIHMHPDAFLPLRSDYPKYSEDHPATKWLRELYSDYLDALGIDIAFRTIRQAQLFWDLHAEVSDAPIDQQKSDAKNLIFMQKILPKFTMDGKAKVRFRNESDPKMRSEIVRLLEQDLKAEAELTMIHPNMHEELHRVRVASESSDKIFNYWA